MDNVQRFREQLRKSRYVTVLTGAGVSAESNIPTFRGSGSSSLWKNHEVTQVASPNAWNCDPGLVWEFYNYRRQMMQDKKFNMAHKALADLEKKLKEQQKTFSLITQNIDDLHFDAGSKNVTRLHGSIWMIRCAKCGHLQKNRDVPITPAFDQECTGEANRYTVDDLPQCQQQNCTGILRPHVVWFGEALRKQDINQAVLSSQNCDLFLVIGTSCLVQPAASFMQLAKSEGAKTAVINLEETVADHHADFVFHGKAGEVLPELFQ
ncbi:SIR2 family NAD-dependent protein deacylase [Candidatus Uabimicrobium amorphum]|uniref:protein acetyllysine N-acetyltransferase n=1 Tax=Uabimicrobium amorphum TaxID=2596890 RepID=A0A5S9IJ00_UABAM|nr:NAD-dependent deacylase [Candidatus Uabimicrobium amorphum]BBM82723.1 NAD-dependent protein deacylase [Candidatus Uabimicrobium amorphum]